MPRPGTDIQIVDDAARGAAVLNTGQAFFVGTCSRGPAGEAQLVRSVSDYKTKCGDRSGGSLLYDSVAAYFTEGGSVLYVSRIVATDAVAATHAFGSLEAEAKTPGAWGNDVTVKAVAPTTTLELARLAQLGFDPEARASGDPIVVEVSSPATGEIEHSPVCATADAIVAWADASSELATFTKGADNVVPDVGTTAALAGGDDGTGQVDYAGVTAALGAFDYALGPGQVAAPGLTTDDVHKALSEHVDTTKRCALYDLPDSGVAADLVASVVKQQGTQGPGTGTRGVRFSAAFAPWAIYPSQAQGATVVVPYSGIQAALIALADVAGNPNEPAAGQNGASRYALGLSQTFSDDDREALNQAGICMAKMVYGAVETYGYRTAAGPEDTNWLWFGNSRVIMGLAHDADAVAEAYVLRQIDGKRRIFAKLEADLRGVCLRYYNAGALFGDSPEEAFSVDTGPGVNTLATIAAGEIHAVIRVRCSPAGEWVPIEIVKVPVERAIAA